MDQAEKRVQAKKARWSAAKKRAIRETKGEGKVDVQAGFDTIEQSKLLEILRELVIEVGLASAIYNYSSLSIF